MMAINNMLGGKMLVCTRERDGEVVIPSGNTELRAGDKISVVIPMAEIGSVLQRLRLRKKTIHSVLIAGGGNTAVYLTLMLQKAGLQVKIIENSIQRCEELAERVIHPDAELGDGVTVYPFVYIGPHATVGSGVKLFPGVYVGENVRIGKGTTVYPNAVLMAGTHVGEGCILHPGSVLGADGFGFARTPAGIQKIPQVGKVTIGNAVEVGANAAIDRAVLDATRIGDGTKIDNLAQIGHNVQIGRNGFVVSQVGISGSTTVGDNCTFAGQVGIAGHLHIGDNVTIGPQSGVAKDIPSDVVVGGTPTVDQRTYMRTLALMPRFPELFKRLSKLEKELEELKGGKPDA